MALPTILFNSSGSDTAASGAGPATALSGTDASTDGAGTVVTLPNADLTNVATDGSHVVWLDTVSGRQWGKITAKASSGTPSANVTVANAFGTGLSGLTYGLGGKRATLDNADSRTIFVDILPGWKIELETNQTLSASAIAMSATGDTATGHIHMHSSSGNRFTITQGANAAHFTLTGHFWHIENIKFDNTNGTKTSANVFSVSGGGTARQHMVFNGCIFGDATNTIRSAWTRSVTAQHTLVMINCEIGHCTSNGIDTFAGSSGTLKMFGCYVHDCVGVGVFPGFGGATGLGAGDDAFVFVGCIFDTNTSHGIHYQDNASLTATILAMNCTFYANGGHGIFIENTRNAVGATILNCIFKGHNGAGDVGLNFDIGQSADDLVSVVDFNCFHDNTAHRANISAGTNDQTDIDPGFVNAGAADFAIGTALKAQGFPDSAADILGSTTASFVDIGAAQREEPASGGGTTIWTSA